MIRENGVVVALEGEAATVAMSSSAHAQCKSCGVCRAAAGGKQMLLDVPAPEGTRVGDRVTVEIPVPGPGRSAALLLLAPAVLFVAGIAVSEWLRQRGTVPWGSGVSVLIGLGLMLLWYLAAGVYDRHLRMSPEHRPRIISDRGRPTG